MQLESISFLLGTLLTVLTASLFPLYHFSTVGKIIALASPEPVEILMSTIATAGSYRKYTENLEGTGACDVRVDGSN